jgi:hypothetical protein
MQGGNVSETIYIQDAMAIIQSINGDQFKTFYNLAATYMQGLLQCFSEANTVVDVYDRYDNMESVKQGERERRQDADPGSRQYQVISGRSIPSWQKFLNNPKNKAALIAFLCQYIINHTQFHLMQYTTHTIYLAGGFADGTVTKCLRANHVEEVDSLSSTQEEADTRMLLHIMKADEIFKNRGVSSRFFVASADTDVMVRLVYYYVQMRSTFQVWMRMGRTTSTVDSRRYLPIHDICTAIGKTFCNTLPAVHCLTVCDSVSSFFVFGKKTVMKLIEDNGPDYYANLAALGETDQKASLDASEKFVSHLYDPKIHDTNLSKLRTKFAQLKDGSLTKLLPSKPIFTQHVLRATWQTQVWMSAHIAKPHIMSPVGHGWERDNGSGCMTPEFFMGPSASEIIDDLLCLCSKTRNTCTVGCTCVQSGLACTELCPCTAAE